MNALDDFRSIPIDDLYESPTNPRKHFNQDALAELAANVKEHGILMPLMVRPNGKPGKFEVIFGARRYRAAKLAGLDAIPARVAKMTDRQVLELQLIENLQREDVHELEEADGYCALLEMRDEHDKPVHTVESMAESFGKTTSYLYMRMKLTSLIPEARKAFFDGKINAGHGEKIARLQTADQLLAVKFCTEMRSWDPEHRVSVRELGEYIRRDIHRNLRQACFDTEDVMLLDKVPVPCSVCPHRTGNAPDWTDDQGSADVCTNPGCFSAKTEAHMDAQRKKLKARGEEFVQVSTGWQAKGAVLPSHRWNQVSQNCKGEKGVKPALIQDGPDQGKIRYVKVESERSQGGSTSHKEWQRRQAEREAEQKRDRDFRNKLLDEILAKMTGAVTPALVGELICKACDNVAELARRHKLKIVTSGAGRSESAAAAIQKLATTTGGTLLAKLAVEAMLLEDVLQFWQKPDALLNMAKRLKVDAQKIRADVEAKHEKPAPAKAAAAKAKTKNKARAAGGGKA